MRSSFTRVDALQRGVSASQESSQCRLARRNPPPENAGWFKMVEPAWLDRGALLG